MTRRVIMFNELGPAALRGINSDIDGRMLLFMEPNENLDVKLDLEEYLETGETISSVDLTTNSVTVASAIAGDSKSTTLTFSAVQTAGNVDVKITLSTGRIWQDTIKARNKRRFTSGRDNLDYGTYLD